MAKEQKLPFFRGTRFRSKTLAQTIPFVEGGEASIEMPNIGLMAMILLEVTGNFNCAAGLTVKDRGIWQLLKNIKVETNLGMAEIYNCSGYGAYLDSFTHMSGIKASGFATVLPGYMPDPAVFYQPVNIGDNPIKFILPIPINANLHKDAIMGLVNLQADTMSCNVTLNFGKSSDVYGSNGGTGFTGNVKLTYLYYELPTKNFEMPPPVVIRRFEKRQTITAKGEQTYKIERMGSLLKIMQYGVIDEQLVPNLENVILKAVDSDTIRDETFGVNRFNSMMTYGQHLPVGTAVLDFWHQDGVPSSGGLRDAFNTSNVSLLEFKTRIPEAWTLDTNKKNDLYTIRTTMQSYTL